MAQVFVSYARRDLAFAEFLGAGLGLEDVQAWIDVHAIGPGDDWQAAVDDALERCAVVVAVVTRSSLGSEYCREEWQKARDAGKAIVLAVVEPLPASLPPELEAAPAVDVRRPEHDRWQRLARAVRDPRPEAPAARPSSSSRIRLPIAMWVGVVALVLILALQVACAYELVRSASRRSLAPEESVTAFRVIVALQVEAAIALVVYTVVVIRRFARRRVSFAQLMVMCLSPSLIAGIGEGAWPNTVLVLEGLVALIAVSGLRKGERGLVPWLPAARLKAEGAASVHSVPGATRRPTTFRLHFAEQDAPVARAVAGVLATAGHAPAEPQEAAAWDLVLLSNATRSEVPALERAGGTAQRVLFVVVSRIRFELAMGALHRLQWFDYRRQEPGELEALATWLATPGAQLREVVWKYKPLGEVSVPAAVSGAVGLLSIVSVIFLAVDAWTLGELAFSGESEFGSWQQVVFPPVAATVMAVTAGGLRHRALTSWQLLGLLACACALVIAAEPGLLAVVAAIVGGFAAGAGYLRTWLLGRRLSWRSAGGLAVESPARGTLRWTVAVIAVSAAVALPLSREIWL